MGLFDQKVLLSDYQACLDEIDRLEGDLAAAKAPPEPSEWLERVMTKRLIVHLRNDQTIDGSLVARMDDGVVLRAARLLSDGTQGGTAMAGEVFIPRENVAFVQLDG